MQNLWTSLTSEVEEILDNCHHGGHLTEHKDAMPRSLQLRQDTIQKLEFTSDAVQVLPVIGNNFTRVSADISRHKCTSDSPWHFVYFPESSTGILNRLEEEWMIAELSQVNNSIHQRATTGLLKDQTLFESLSNNTTYTSNVPVYCQWVVLSAYVCTGPSGGPTCHI